MDDQAVITRSLLVQARHEFGKAAADGSVQAAEIIKQYEKEYKQAAATSRGSTKQGRRIAIVVPSPEITRLRIAVKYEALDANATRREFDRLNAALTRLGDAVIYTVDQIVPILSDVQTLTSQRGAARKQVLREANLPEWTPFLQTYAEKFGIGIRQLQRKIAAHRGKAAVKKPKMKPSKPSAEETDIEAEVKRRLVPFVEAAERYISALERRIAYPVATKDGEYALRKRCEAWRERLRYARGLKVTQDEDEEDAA
jgi:hypothetical protein